MHYTNCQLLLFFTEWRDRYSGPVSASTQQQRLLIAFRWTVLLAAVAAMVPFGSLVQAQVNSNSTLPETVRFYINASGPIGDGSGSSAANAADASTPAKYYAINQSHTTPGTVIMYAAGTYLMNTGFWCWNGIRHQGSGIDSTIIKVSDNSSPYNPMFTSGAAGCPISIFLMPHWI